MKMFGVVSLFRDLRRGQIRIPRAGCIRLTSPSRAALLVLDSRLGHQYSIALLAEFEYTQVDPRPGSRGSVIFLSPSIVAGTLRRLVSGAIAREWNWRKRLVFSYFTAVIRHVNPRAVITMRGAFTPWFGRLANEFPNIEFIAVAAAQVHSAHSANVIPSRAHYYVYGPFDRERMIAAGQSPSLVHAVGPLLGGYVQATGGTRAEKCYDICIPSQVVDLSLLADGRALLQDRPTLLHIQRRLAEYVSRYARENRMRVAVALRPQELGTEGAEAERRFFQDIMRCDYQLIESEPEKFSTYHAIARSRIVVTHCSTTGFEVMCWPKRVLFCEFIPYGPYRVPDELEWRVTGEYYDAFRDKMDELLNISDDVFGARGAASISYFNAYSPLLPPHVAIAHHVKRALVPRTEMTSGATASMQNAKCRIQ